MACKQLEVSEMLQGDRLAQNSFTMVFDEMWQCSGCAVPHAGWRCGQPGR